MIVEQYYYPELPTPEYSQTPDVSRDSPSQTSMYSWFRGHEYIGHCGLYDEEAQECYLYDWSYYHVDQYGDVSHLYVNTTEEPVYQEDAMDFNLVSVTQNLATGSYNFEIEYVYEVYELNDLCASSSEICVKYNWLYEIHENGYSDYFYFEILANNEVVWTSNELITDVNGWYYLYNMSSNTISFQIEEISNPLKLEVKAYSCAIRKSYINEYLDDCITSMPEENLNDIQIGYNYNGNYFHQTYFEQENIGEYSFVVNDDQIVFETNLQQNLINVPVAINSSETTYEVITITNLTQGKTTYPYLINDLIIVEGSENLPYLINFNEDVEIEINLDGYEVGTTLNASWELHNSNKYVLSINDVIHYDHNDDLYKQGYGDPLYTYENIILFPEDIANNYGTIKFSIPVNNIYYETIDITLEIGTRYSYVGNVNSMYQFIEVEPMKLDESNSTLIFSIPEEDFDEEVTIEKLEEWLIYG